MMLIPQQETRCGLYNPQAPARAHCGVGVLVNLSAGAQHRVIEDGFELLRNLSHRGARGAEEQTGDGAGLLLQKPHAFFSSKISELGDADGYAVAQLFMPADSVLREKIISQMESLLRQRNFVAHAWRNLDTDHSPLGETARACEPLVMQCFVKPLQDIGIERFDAALYVLRHVIEKSMYERLPESRDRFYICSLHRQQIVYKGLLTAEQLPVYYPELSDPRVTSAFVLVHARFSTNTLGAWSLAHPYRCCVHNGEINTLRGNFNAMMSRQGDLASDRFGDDIELIKPIIYEGQSDTAVFDNVLELLLQAGRSLPHALRMLVPEAWENDRLLSAQRRAFYDYHAHLMEPWDGPALIAASDGQRVAAILDRNGLRPCRYYLTHDDRLIMASETGVLDIAEKNIRSKGRLRPGELLLADTVQQRLLDSDEVFRLLAAKPYAQWLASRRLYLRDLCKKAAANIEPWPDHVPPETLQRNFDYTSESLRYLLKPMAEFGKDPIGSMGNDTPLAVLSGKHRSLFQYFSQLFAQVSNPPLDYIREQLVTSLQCPVGRKRNLLAESADHCRQLSLDSPLLSAAELGALHSMQQNGMRSREISMTFALATDLHQAIENLQQQVVRTIDEGFEIIILSDRDCSAQRLAIPALLACSAVHHDLIDRGLRTRCALILDTAHPHTVHHFCSLLGYGADAIYPWLAYRSIRHMRDDQWLQGGQDELFARYRQAIEGGILKVMSKMGISTLASYKGAQVFEITGLDAQMVNDYFYGTASRIPGVGLQQIETELRQKHRAAFGAQVPGNLLLEPGGDLYWRRDGEIHHWNPHTIGRLQHAVKSGDVSVYEEFAAYSNEQDTQLHTLRGLLEFDLRAEHSVPIEEVEPVTDIVKRFATASMSFGALSQEAHETLAIAMNRLGAGSGTGEGGEQAERFGSERQCSMKQVASGRFGVDISYLNHATDIEIKMAQGSKPGEGGELPGDKVDANIARVRFTVPGVGLISPPPHHDIYSIEDLAQLIHDLKCANPGASIHVKLVAEHGVGTIAAGVCKARADRVLISGDSGGTGASVKTSIKSAGCAWELGLAETQQVLLANNLRSRIRLRVDGGLRTGRDVVIGALLGAEEFGFGTAPLVALGCVMLRKCHCNTCSVGIATQDPELRKRFTGQPEHVVNYMLFLASEVRFLMAALGFRKFDDMVGRVDKLRQKNRLTPKGVKVDIGQLLYRQASQDSLYQTRAQNHKLEQQLDHVFIRQMGDGLPLQKALYLQHRMRNRDRSVGAMLSSHIVQRLWSQGLASDALPDDALRIACSGCAGQSFGAFLVKGVTLDLEGDANDYVGKGLSGGRVIIRRPAAGHYVAAENVIIGNVALYGATRGELYVNGLAGERFAVRNSGAVAVVEGVGNHGCEYMTGGTVLILGDMGYNFGAGMSGGEAFVYDEHNTLDRHLNTQMVHVESCGGERDWQMIFRLLQNHHIHTGSRRARSILADWSRQRGRFKKVVSEAYSRVVNARLEQGEDIRTAIPALAAQHDFYLSAVR
jgi:glutamate synthase (NADPH/NADH) large chain